MALIASLAGCSAPSDSSPPGLPPGSPPGGGSSTYFFYADYRYVENTGGAPNPYAWGSIYSYKDNGATWADAQSLDGTAFGTTLNVNNNLTAAGPGHSVPLSVTLDGTAFTGSALIPNILANVVLTQNLATVTPDPTTRHINLSASDPVVVSWGIAPLIHPAAFVTVAITNGATLKAAFSTGNLTLPAGWAASGSDFRVYAANEATDLSPTTDLDTVHAYFRVSHADGLADYFLVN